MFRPACLAFALALATLVPAPPALAASFSIEPPDTTVTVGDTFTLRVMCDAVSDLKGFQSAYGFAAARLQFVAMPAGNLLTDGGGDWFAILLPDVTAPVDTAWMDAAKLDGSAAGPGIAAYLTFKALLIGDAPLECLFAEMRDSNNASLSPTCTGGLVHVIGPVPVERRTWGRIKTLYR
jgi:hypothetical protein